MNSTEKADRRSQPSLTRSAELYFKKKGYKIEQHRTTLEGYSGTSREFDLIVQKGRSTQGVWIKNWKRTVGVNVVISLDKASDDVGFSNPIIVGEKFSDHARSYANRRRITLLTKRQIHLATQ